MAQKHIRSCILGAGENTLHVLGELHKQRNVDIAFVFDPHAGAVGHDIAEILGVPSITDVEAIAQYLPLDVAVIPDRGTLFTHEIARLEGAGVEILNATDALERFCGHVAQPEAAATKPKAPYSLDDALSAFERLFDREELLRYLLDIGVRATGAAAGSIMMYSEQSQDLYIAYATGLSERVVHNTRQRLGEGIAGVVASERKGKLIQQAPVQSLYSTDRDRHDIHSAISVPLVDGDTLLGVLNVSSGSGDRKLDVAGLGKLEKLSGRIARVLSESTKLQDVQVRREEVRLRQTVGEISEKSVSIGEKFRVIAAVLGDVVGAQTVEVFVGTREGDWLILGGSNRRLSAHPELLRLDRGALARSYVECRTIVLTEGVDDRGDDLASSFVFVPLHITETLGVLMLEFEERSRLEAFLGIRESVALEVSRFVASERREGRLRAELTSLAKISDAAPMMLTCQSLDDLCELMSRLVADALECERVSVRVQGAEGGRMARYEDSGGRTETWYEEDEERFLKLKKNQQSFTLSFMNFSPVAAESGRAYHSLLAVPILVDDQFRGGVIAYDKRLGSALDESTFTKLDETILEQIVAMAVPVVRSLGQGASAPPEAASHEEALTGNTQRLERMIESEISRAERYHQSFSVLALRIAPIAKLFEDDAVRAHALVDEITRGIQTRTRKTDYGCWIRRDTFALISLEGGRRIRFLISRLLLYLIKDLSGAGLSAIGEEDVEVGLAGYPGVSRTATALLSEAEEDLRPHHKR